ncbi:VOC family protein [Quadrisphaera oryzae]|uniref:VOC family protein n=1 Tax=Quadrisphaera TaxID=317661 RepID=UPI001647A30F|nr:VOC family protein [Quadrisphaera sp. RL12-1S]MBC3762306.1 VOC family protein [Quadrisphaera sp. RL12-1S]
MSNLVTYFEIGTPDAAAARAFYGGVFGWRVADAGPAGYAPVNGAAGGLWNTTGIGGGSWAIFYVEVADVSAALDAVTAHGGRVVVPRVDNGAIVFAHVADPAGNRFGLWRRKAIADARP